MVVRVRVEGLKELQVALRSLPDATAKNVIRRVLLARGKPIAEAARQRVPVFKGFLRSSIGVSTRLTRRQRGKHRKAGPDDVEVFVGAGSDPAAHLQEFGTSKAPAQPFLRPAWDAEKENTLKGIAADMWAEIEKAAMRLAKKAAKAAKR